MFSCSHEGHDHEHEGHDHAAETHEEHDHDEISLPPATAERLGVRTDSVTLHPFGQVLKVSAVVSTASESAGAVSATTSGIITLASGVNVGTEVKKGQLIGTIKADAVSGGDANRAARVELEAAQREFSRVSTLYADHLITAAQYNEAKAALDRARAAYSAPAASGRVTAPIAGVITSLDVKSGDFVATGAPVAAVGSASRLTIRADVPAKSYHTVAAARDARIVIPSTDESYLVSQLSGRRTDTANATAAAAGGYVPMTFTVNNNGRLIPGSVLEMYIFEPTDRLALTVPNSAITEQQGNFFVYIRLDEDCYRKVAVKRGATNGIETEILSGLKPGDIVVTEGATIVRLAEAGKNIPEGHSHSH